MSDITHGNDKSENAESNPVSVGDTVRAQSVTPANVEENIRSALSNDDSKENAGESNQIPLFRVDVVKDESLSGFERRTILLGRAGFWVAVITIGLGVVTAVIFWNQFREMAGQTDMLSISAKQARRDSAESDLRAQQQIAALQAQVNATQESIKAIRRQFRQDQRAWITVDPISMPTSFGVNNTVTSTITVTNIGKTMAREVVVHARLELVKNGDDPALWYPAGHQGGFIHALWPNKPQEFPVEWRLGKKVKGGVLVTTFRLSATDLSNLIAGKSYFATYALIRFKDTFGVKHWVHVCAWKAYGPEYPGVTALKCTQYNDADNN